MKRFKALLRKMAFRSNFLNYEILLRGNVSLKNELSSIKSKGKKGGTFHYQLSHLHLLVKKC